VSLKLVKEENGVEKDSEGYVDQVKTLLGKYGCYNWLRQLGFLYCSEKKPTTIAYRVAFISRYFEYERRTHTSQAFDLQEEGEIVKKHWL
jgi:hypothetical protein